tara:strand:- start:2676 stop:3329 length:654 start_codon:yes stop_codon:yes gene_type:complete
MDKSIAEEKCELVNTDDNIIEEDFTSEEIEKIYRVLNKRKEDGNLEKYEVLKNPFAFNSDFEVRITLDKDPKKHKGNTEYITAYHTDKNIQFVNEDDAGVNYIFGKNKLDKSIHKSTIEDYDYQVPAIVLNGGDENGIHKDGLPLSFLNIKTEQDGAIWYKQHYPKIPDDLIPIISRYHWGDPITKKSVKNERKKITKKLQQKGLKIENKKVSVIFN